MRVSAASVNIVALVKIRTISEGLIGMRKQYFLEMYLFFAAAYILRIPYCAVHELYVSGPVGVFVKSVHVLYAAAFSARGGRLKGAYASKRLTEVDFA